MQIIIEGLALAAFNLARQGTFDPVFKDMLYLIIRDEARHVTFGVNYLEEFVKTLSDEERGKSSICLRSLRSREQVNVFRGFTNISDGMLRMQLLFKASLTLLTTSSIYCLQG